MKTITTTLMLLFAINMNSQITTDKYYHAAAGTLIGTMSGGLAYTLTNNLKQSIGAAFTMGTLAGITKELYDTRSGGSGWNNEDLVATMVVATVSSYLTYLINKKKRTKV